MIAKLVDTEDGATNEDAMITIKIITKVTVEKNLSISIIITCELEGYDMLKHFKKGVPEVLAMQQNENIRTILL